MRRFTSLAIIVATLAALALLAWPLLVALRPRPSAAASPTSVGDHQEQLPLTDLLIAPAGEELLLNTLARLEQRSSITARIRHRAAIEGHDFFGQGTYRQQGSGEKRQIKWLLESQREGFGATLLQVSNGRYLWTDRRLPSGRHIDRVDLWQLRRKLDTTTVAGEPLAPGQAGWSPIHPDMWTSFGGLPMVLGSLRESFEFTAPRLFRMGQTPVYATVGRWRPNVLADILASSAANADESPRVVIGRYPIPPHVPHHVLVLIGQHDAFPYMIEYRSGGDDTGGKLDELYQPVEEPLARLEMYDVQFDVAIDNREFDYQPPLEPDWSDNTARFLRRIDRSRQYEFARQQPRDLATRASAVPHSR